MTKTALAILPLRFRSISFKDAWHTPLQEGYAHMISSSRTRQFVVF